MKHSMGTMEKLNFINEPEDRTRPVLMAKVRMTKGTAIGTAPGRSNRPCLAEGMGSHCRTETEIVSNADQTEIGKRQIIKR